MILIYQNLDCNYICPFLLCRSPNQNIHIFCSFRANVPPKILRKLESIEVNTQFCWNLAKAQQENWESGDLADKKYGFYFFNVLACVSSRKGAVHKWYPILGRGGRFSKIEESLCKKAFSIGGKLEIGGRGEAGGSKMIPTNWISFMGGPLF